MRAIGIDIGTTTICGIVVDSQTGEVLATRTLPNDSTLTSPVPFFRLQDPEIIKKKALEIITSFLRDFSPIGAIGTTGQMHGMLYLDQAGKPLSPLATWQDARGEEEEKPGVSYAASLSAKLSCPMATGFGLTTHYYNMKNGLVPPGAASLSTIGDYIGMTLCGQTRPFLSPGNAASFGAFDPATGSFRTEALAQTGMDLSLLPELIADATPIGQTSEGIPVSVSVGDNQASVMGSVQDLTGTVLLNVGTSGQVSCGLSQLIPSQGEIEFRPCTPKHNILVGCTLCGGYSYALLRNFFQEVLAMAGIPKAEERSLYEEMSKWMTTHPPKSDSLLCSTRFAGTRSNPALRGSITEISRENFTVSNFIQGILQGMVEELHTLYEKMLSMGAAPAKKLVGSGNAIRMNPLLQHYMEEAFHLPLSIPAHTEEASYGTALFALTCAGAFSSVEKAQSILHYCH